MYEVVQHQTHYLVTLFHENCFNQLLDADGIRELNINIKLLNTNSIVLKYLILINNAISYLIKTFIEFVILI